MATLRPCSPCVLCASATAKLAGDAVRSFSVAGCIRLSAQQRQHQRNRSQARNADLRTQVLRPKLRQLLSRKPSSSAVNAQANDPQQLLAAGQAAQDQKRFDEAIRHLQSRDCACPQTKPQTAAIANLKIGNAYMVQGKFGNAQVAFERAVALNPNYAEAYNNLGEALGELKQYPRAIEAFTKAISLDPTLLKAKYNQAVSYDRMGNFRYSEFVFRKFDQEQSRLLARLRRSRRHAFKSRTSERSDCIS